MKRVAILSDTHGLLRDEVKSILSGVDAIIHAGDINTPTIVKELEAFAPLYIVRGNNDKEWAEALPESLFFSIEGINIYVVHNKKDIPQDIEDTDTDLSLIHILSKLLSESCSTTSSQVAKRLWGVSDKSRK